MGIYIPPRTDPNTGQPIITTEDRYNDLMTQYNANQSFQNSAGQGIPGLTAPVGQGAGIPGWRGVIPQGQGQAIPPAQPAPFSASGPYGQQASAMAGLLAQPQQPQQPMQSVAGLLSRRGFRVPGGK